MLERREGTPRPREVPPQPLRRAAVAAACALTLCASLSAWAHGGNYQPPDPPADPGEPAEPRDPGKGPSPPPPPSGGPTTPGPDAGPSGPTTPGGGAPPTTPGPDPSGPTTPGPGPTTPPSRTKPRSGGGVSPEHWTRWWYANRLALLEVSARVSERETTTPSASPEPASGGAMWRAEAQEALTLALADRDEDIASGAAVALGKAGDAADAPVLAAVLADRRRAQTVREAAALGLGLLDVDPRADAARKALVLTASDESSPVRLRAFAVYALGLRGEPAAIPFLLEAAAASEPTWDVAAAAASALGLSRCELASEDLQRMLEGPRVNKRRESTRRVYAAHGLARLGERSVVPALREEGRDDDPGVRRAVILALGALASPDDTKTAEFLAAALRRDDDRGCRNMAALALGRCAPARAAHELRWAYENGDSLEQPFAALGLGLLARRLGDGEIPKLLVRDLVERANSDLRGALCIAVGLAGDASGIPALRKLAGERGDPELRAHAAMGLGLLGDRAGGPAVLRRLLAEAPSPSAQREAAFALGMLGDREAIESLLASLRDGGSVYVQGSAAVALGRIGGEESVRPLVTLLRDDSRPGIARAMAAVALGLVLDRTEGRRLASIGADLDWYALTPTVREVLDIL